MGFINNNYKHIKYDIGNKLILSEDIPGFALNPEEVLDVLEVLEVRVTVDRVYYIDKAGRQYDQRYCIALFDLQDEICQIFTEAFIDDNIDLVTVNDLIDKYYPSDY